MQISSFEHAIQILLRSDTRYTAEGYRLVRESLDETLRCVMEKEKKPRHVSGAELLSDFRSYALKQYGPLTKTILARFGIHATRDVGEIVFNLIRIGMLGKTDEDRVEDFDRLYDFDEAFLTPFRPAPKPPTPKPVTQDKKA